MSTRILIETMSCVECHGLCQGHLEVIDNFDDDQLDGRSVQLDGHQRSAKDFPSNEQLSRHGNAESDTIPRSPSMVSDGGRKRKLVLHFDLRNTLLVADSVTKVSVEQALNAFLTGATWGQEVEGRWVLYNHEPSIKPPAPGLVTYYKFLERHLVPTISDRTALRLATGDFTLTSCGAIFRPHFHSYLQLLRWPYADQDGVSQRLLTMAGSDGQRYHYLLEAVYRLIHYLHDNDREAAFVIRTYGLDAANVLASLQHGLKGNHPGFHKPLNLPCCCTPGTIRRPKTDLIILEAFHPESSTELQVRLTQERDIYRHLSSSKGISGYMDDFWYWQAHGYNHHAGKPLWIDPSDKRHHHIFFDDNFRALDEDSIVDVRVFSQDEATQTHSLGKHQLSRLEDVCLVQADLLQSIEDTDYFVKKVELCEQNFSHMMKMNMFPV